MYQLLFYPEPNSSPITTAEYADVAHAAISLPAQFLRSLYHPDATAEQWRLVNEAGVDVGATLRRTLLNHRKAHGLHDVNTSPSPKVGTRRQLQEHRTHEREYDVKTGKPTLFGKDKLSELAPI